MKPVEDLVAFSAQVEGQGVTDHQNCTYNRAELKALALALFELPQNARVVEIGTFAGRSASLYFQLQPDFDFDIHLVDNWSWNAAMAKPAFEKLIAEHFSQIPFTFHCALSADLGKEWSLPIDFLHVDGLHDMAGIESDCQLWLPWVVPGGIAAFHDSNAPDIKICIDKYVQQTGWTIFQEAERTTVWKKPNA
jgi:predicted O-methyltransferase YrrM